MARASSTSAVVPGQKPRAVVFPKPRWSGENTAMPASAKSGPGSSHASRLSFMPCSASITAHGAPTGSQARYGSRMPSGMTNASAVSFTGSIGGPGGTRCAAHAARFGSRDSASSRTRRGKRDIKLNALRAQGMHAGQALPR